MAYRPVGVGQSIALAAGTASAVAVANTSTAYFVESSIVRLVPKDADVHVSVASSDMIGESTDAAGINKFYIPENEATCIAQTKCGFKIESITGGATTKVYGQEGTSLAFVIGDHVGITTAGEPNWGQLNYKKVTAVTQGRNPYVTVNYDSSGISTAFTANTGGELKLMNKVSAMTAHGATAGYLYIQQVQFSGEG